VSFTVQVLGFVAASGQMQAARYGQTATRLTNGQVLIAGGMSSSGVTNSAEIYTLASQTFAAASSAMNVPRWLHTATLLNDGTVLIAGGSSLSNEPTLNTAEIYDPVAGTFTLLVNTLNTARVGHTATLLSNGQVLIVGGYDPSTGLISDAELYDPASQVFIDLGNTNSPRFHHAATLLQSGQVLLTGGETDPTPSGAYNTAEIFNPMTWTFSPVSANMTSGREGHTATLLNDGTVLITGGDLPGTGSLGTAEIYNPSSGAFTASSAAMTSPRIFHVATLLNGGKVLLSGGANDSGGASVILNTAELYDPVTQTFTATAGNMSTVREHQTATLLNDGTVLEDGGTDGTNVFNSVEIYTASQLSGLTSISISPASPSVPLGSQELLTATGTFSGGTQVLSSVLWSSSSAAVSAVSNDTSDSGYVTTVAQGTATITATAGGISGSTTVAVPAPTLVSITLSPQTPAMPLGTTQQFDAIGTYSDGSVQDLTATAIWASSSSSVAPVSSAGLATGVSQGISTIQATLGSQSGSTNVTVGPPALVSLVLNPVSATVAIGASQQYQVAGIYSDGSTQNITNSVEWSFLPGTIAMLQSPGLVIGSSQGTGTVQAALGTVSGSATLTVVPASLVSVAVSPSSVSVDVGGTQQLSAVGTYSNSTSSDVTSSSTWVSANPTIATVSATGLVSALANGTITVTATSGSVSGSAAITVGTSNSSPLSTSLYEQDATLLNDGTVLIAGGVSCSATNSCSYLAAGDVYNPDAGTVTRRPSLSTPRSAPAVLLPNGNVLVAGGYSCDSSGNCASVQSAQVFLMEYGFFGHAVNMTSPRSGHTETLLGNGQVLIAGGQNCTSASSCTALNTAEIYNPVAGTFTAVGNLNAARFNATATLLNQGQVLIAGGLDGTNYLTSAELYDPVAQTFTTTGNLNAARASATATLLNAGQVLIAGGSNCNPPGCPINSAELYNAAAGTFSYIGTMTTSRFAHSATLLTNGQVLIAGGYSSCSSTCTSDPTAELYDPVAGTFSTTPALSTGRAGHTGTLLTSGDVLLVGGINAGTTLSSMDLYEPTNLTPAGLQSIAILPSNPSVPIGGIGQLAAIGTFSNGNTETLQSVIWSSLNLNLTSISNASGAAGYVSPQVADETSVISAAAGAITGSTLLTGAPLLSSLTVTPQSEAMFPGQSQQFDVVGNYSDGSTKDLTSAATWNSSNPAVGTVSSGIVTAVNPGTASITASFGTLSTSASLTVELATPSLSSLSVTSGPVGTAVTISGADFGNAQNSGSVTFDSVNAPVLSWSNASIVAQVPAGATTGPVQVTAGGVGSNTIAFTVTPPPPTILALSEFTGLVGDTITISGSAFGTSGSISFSGVPSSASSWSDSAIVTQIPAGAQTGPVTVTSAGETSNGFNLTIIAAPVITGVSPASGDVGTVVTISGTNFGAPESDDAVVFDGSAVAPTNWTSTQIVAAVPKGTSSGPLLVRIGHIASNSMNFTIVPTGSQVLSIFPANATLAIGQTLNLSLTDDLEHNITGASWTLSDSTLAQLSSNDPPVLTAEKAGSETITATWSGLSATTKVTILASGVIMPAGTVVWSLPTTTSSYTVLKIMQAVPTDGTTPDLIAVEDDGQGSIWLRGISAAGEQLWHIRVGSSMFINGQDVGPGPDFVVQEMPDNFGGALVLVQREVAGASSFIRFEGHTGKQTWRYDSPGSFCQWDNWFCAGLSSGSTSLLNQDHGNSAFAIDQNGYILAVETIQTQNSASASLIKIDPVAGVPAARWQLPSQATGGISVGPDGSYYLEVGGSADGVGNTSLLTVSPSGSTSYTALAAGWGTDPGNVIPDGNGGVLAQSLTLSRYGDQNFMNITHVGATGGSATVPLGSIWSGDWGYTNGFEDMVLGDQGTYFTTDHQQVRAFDEASGNQLWSWTPSPWAVNTYTPWVEIIAATAGGGVAVREIQTTANSTNGIPTGQEDVVRLDSNGNATYDSWGTSSGSAAYGVLSNSTYWVNGEWVGVSSDPVIEAVSGETLEVAVTDWSSGAGGGGGGNRQGQNRPKLPEIITFLPSHLSEPNQPQNDVPAFYTSMLGGAQNNQIFKAQVPSINNIQNDGGTLTGQTPVAEQTFFDGMDPVHGTATASTFLAWMQHPIDALAFIGHAIDTHYDNPDIDFSYGINFYLPKAASVNCPDPTVKKPDPIHDGWDMEYYGEGIVNGVLNVPIATYLPCEPKWNDHKLITIEENSTVALAHLGANWLYINSPWTLPVYHPQLLVSEKMFPQAKILFFASCALNPTFGKPGEVPPFIQMWDIHDPTIDRIQETRQRAIVVPTTPVALLATAAAKWQSILQNLTAGKNIQDAVGNDANWKVLGNPNVTISSSKSKK
jgi:hypothetical protein